MPHIAVVIPFYNNAATFDELITRLVDSLSTICPDFSIVCVDDCGPEPMWPLITKAASADPRITGLKLSRNFGQHRAITAGLDQVDADWVVVMDGDLQDRPEDIPLLYRAAIDGANDVVIAKRETQGTSWWRQMGSRGFNAIVSRASGLRLSHEYGNFRIVSRRAMDAFRMYREQMRLFPAIMDEIGFDPVYLELSRDERPVGKSSYTLMRLIALSYSTIIAYSTKPLIFMAVTGLFIAFGAGGSGVFILVRQLIVGSTVPGWASLAVATAFMGGLQIFVTSVVGLYVGQVFSETKRRPLYIIRMRTDDVRQNLQQREAGGACLS